MKLSQHDLENFSTLFFMSAQELGMDVDKLLSTMRDNIQTSSHRPSEPNIKEAFEEAANEGASEEKRWR